MEKIKKLDRNSVMLAVCAVLGIIVVSVAGVLVVRAYLTAVTNNKINPFAPMTYTNTEIEEPTSSWPDTPQDTSYDVYINKSAKVKNLPGADKKPVFIRVAVTYSVYDNNGVNVTPEYPCTISFAKASDDWTDKTGGYYYYKYIIDPGETTTELFKQNNFTVSGANKSVKVDCTKTIPDGYRIEIDVIADTVQAVSTDSSKWTSADYETKDAKAAWGSLPEGVTAAKKSS